MTQFLRVTDGEVPSFSNISSCSMTGVGQGFNNKGSICVQSDMELILNRLGAQRAAEQGLSVSYTC